MIEMLVTLTMFALALSALVAGLRSGAATWRTVKRHGEESALLERAQAIVRDDLAHLKRGQDDEPAFAEEGSGTPRESLSFGRLATRSGQQFGARREWSRIVYLLLENESGQQADLVRKETPCVAKGALRGAEGETVLLPGVKSLRIDYWNGEEFVLAWDDAEKLPVQVQLTLERERGASLTFAGSSPLGAFGAGAP